MWLEPNLRWHFFAEVQESIFLFPIPQPEPCKNHPSSWLRLHLDAWCRGANFTLPGCGENALLNFVEEGLQSGMHYHKMCMCCDNCWLGDSDLISMNHEMHVVLLRKQWQVSWLRTTSHGSWMVFFLHGINHSKLSAQKVSHIDIRCRLFLPQINVHPHEDGFFEDPEGQDWGKSI